MPGCSSAIPSRILDPAAWIAEPPHHMENGASLIAQASSRPGRYLRRRWVLLPTWRLVVAAAIAIGGPAFFAFFHLYGWLAVMEPISGTRILIVEGWIPDHALKRAAEHAKATDAEIFCSGTPLDRGTLDLPYKTYAEYAAATLIKMGVPPERVHAVPCEGATTGRTRQMARSVADRLQRPPPVLSDKRANLITYAAHGRRTRSIYREELGENWQLGVISYPDPDVNPRRWFLASKSVKETINEVVALTMGILGGN